MLFLFRTNQFLASILFLPYLLLLRFTSYWFSGTAATLEQGSGLAFGWLTELTGTSGWLPLLISALLLFITATWLTAFAIQTRLSREVTLFPGVCFILVCSLFPECLLLSPVQVANLFLLAALTQLNATYKKYPVAGLLFNAGLWIAVASLFVPAYVLFLILGLAGMNALRAFKLRESLMLLTGFITPYWILFAVLFWLDEIRQLQQHFHFAIGFVDPSGLALAPWVPKVVLIGFLVLAVLFSFRQYIIKTSIKVQKTIQLLFWLLFSAGLAVLFQAHLSIAHVQVSALALGVLLGLNFSQLKPGWSELLHLLLLGAAGFFQLSGQLF